MTRLTDERLAAILAPPDIIGETELVSLAREVVELRAENRSLFDASLTHSAVCSQAESQIEQLTRELAEAIRTIDLQCKQIGHQAKQCQEIENERDAAREFNRRFRFSGESSGVDDYEFWAVARDYDATQTPQPHPPQTEWVPWTSETRPRGPMTIRKTGQTAAEFAPGWMEYGETSDGSRILFETLLEDYEWSRDGKEWQRCGTEVTR